MKMDGDPGVSEKLYRLRLVLPDLSQPVVDNWIASLQKTIPPEFFHDDDGIFAPPERKRNALYNSKLRHHEAREKYEVSVDEDSECECAAEQDEPRTSHEVWLQVGEMAPRGPVPHTWEVCHGLENDLLEKTSGDFRAISGTHLFRSGPLRPKSIVTDFKLNAVNQCSDFAARTLLETIPESDLVRDSIYALQGLPAAVRKLERLAKTYCSTSTDKSAHSLSDLWTSSVTASALGKLLAVVADAGHIRCLLDAFVSFFLDGRHGAHEENREDAVTHNKKISKKMKKNRAARAEKHTNERTAMNSAAPSERRVPSYCLVNQAFAAAVRGILRGHSAALNTLASSINLRRGQNIVHTYGGGDLRMQDPGPVIGYGSRDISLLEFYLHTRELRVQLQALAFVCLTSDGTSSGGSSSNGLLSWKNWMDMNGNEEKESIKKPRNRDLEYPRSDDKSDPLLRSFDKFPRGADLLTYLYDQLMEVDPLYSELLRFLFERAYEPYSVFIRSWLFQAAVSDPYREFVIEQADFSTVSSSEAVDGNGLVDLHPKYLRLRRAVFVPRFMENVCTPLIRAGEQLQVLLKLAETCELAQQMANITDASEVVKQPQSYTKSPVDSNNGSSCCPALVFSKRKLDRAVSWRAQKSQEMNEKFDSLFSKLLSRRLKKEKFRNISCSSSPSSLSIGVEITDTEGKAVSFISQDLQQQSHQQPPLIQSAWPRQVSSERIVLEATVTLPRRPWVMSAEEEEAGDDSGPSCRAKSRRHWQVSSKASVINRVEQTGDESMTDVMADASHSPLDFRDPFQAWFMPEITNDGTEGQSLLADYQRGTSWPLWGLPANPFLVPECGDDFTQKPYLHTSFTGTYQHWDVTTKWKATNLISNQEPGVKKSKESSKQRRESNIEPVWFESVVSDLYAQLFRGLDAQIELAENDSDDSYSTELLCPLNDEVQEFGSVTSESQDPVGLSETITKLGKLKVDVDTSRNSGIGLAGNDSYDSFLSGLLCSSNQEALESRSGASVSEDPAVLLDTISKLKVGGDVERNTGVGLAENEYCDSYSTNEAEESGSTSLEFKDPAGMLETTPKLGKPEVDGDTSRNSAMGLSMFANEISNHGQGGTNSATEQVEPQSPVDERLQGPANWEQHLRFSDHRNSDAIQESTDNFMDEVEGCADEEIPLSVVVGKCIIEEILSQYQSVSTLTVRLFQEGLCLQDHYSALRRYLFMERGDWADYFTAALCQHRWGPSRGRLLQMEVQGMLEAAFQRSSCEGDDYSERVHVSFQESRYNSENMIHGSSRTSMSSFVDCSRLDAFDFIILEYQVAWPLSLILTTHSLRLYNIVFTFLMRIKLTEHAFGDIWQRLQGIDRSLHKERNSSTFQQQRNRFQTLQQFRQQIYHFVTTVQRYMESKLLSEAWSKFLHNIQTEVNDMQDLEIVHCAYLEAAINECFLSAKTQGVKGCIDSIMQCVLDFSSHMRNAFDLSNEKCYLIDDRLFAQVHELKKCFQVSLQQLHGYQLERKLQTGSNLADLWMILDFNSFLTNVLSVTQL